MFSTVNNERMKHCISVRQGKFRAETVVYRPNGSSVVTPLSDWTTYDEAMKVIQEAKKPE
jgi:hypothetical protein